MYKPVNVVAIKQLAEAFVHVAKVNHYMVGVVYHFTSDELDAAEQLLIDQQNAGPQKGAAFQVLDRALDAIEYERTKLRRTPRVAHELDHVRRQEVERALQEVLNHFGSEAILREITPDEAASVRSCPMMTTPKVADVYRWIALLKS